MALASTAPTAAPTAILPDIMRGAQIASFARQTPINLAVTLAVAVVTATILWPVAPHNWIVLWVALHVLVSARTFRIWWRGRRRLRPESVSEKAIRRAIGWVMLSGALWGANALWMAALPDNYAAILMLVAGGMAAGAATTLAAVPRAATAFILLAILPHMAAFVARGDQLNVAIGLLALVLALAMLAASRVVYDSFLAALRAEQTSAALLARIAEERQEWLEIAETAEAFALFDRDDSLLLWSRNFPRFLSLPENFPVRGMKRRQILARAAWTGRLADVDGTGEGPVVCQCPDGRWLRMSGHRTKAGRTVLTFVDITALKETERAARESEERVRLIAANIPGIVFERRRRGDGTFFYTYISDGIRDLVGVEPAEIFRDARVLQEATHPDDREPWLARMRAAADAQVEYHGEHRLVHRSGAIKWVRYAARPREVEGETVFDGVLIEITDEKQAQLAREASDRRLRAFMDNVLDVVSLLDADGTIRYESPSVADALGYQPQELVGRIAFDLIHPEDLPRVADVFAQKIQVPGARGEVECRFRHKDGSWRVLEVRGRNLLAEPSVGGVLVSSRDITERRVAEQAAAQARANLEDAIESIDQALLLYDANERIVLFNQNYLSHFPEVADFVHPGQTFEEVFRELIRRGAVAVPENEVEDCMRERLARFRRADGRPLRRRLNDGRHIEVTERRSRLGGTIGIGTDVTARLASEAALRDSERRFRALIDKAIDIILIVNPDGNVRFASPATREMLGYDPEEVVGSPLLSYVHPEDLPRAAQALANGFAKPGSVIDLELRARHADGAWRILAVNGRSLVDDPAIAGGIITARDVTDRRAAEKAAERARAHLEDTIATINQALVLHDSDDRIVFFNQKLTEFYPGLADYIAVGRTFEDVLREAVRRRLVPEAAADPEAYIRERLALHRRADGTPILRRMHGGHYLQAFEIRTREGGILSVGTDVTEALLREAALRDSRDQLRTITDNLPAVVTFVDSGLRYRFVNRTYSEWFAVAQDSLIGQDLREVLPADFLDKAMPHMREALAGRPARLEVALKYPDGVMRQVDIQYVPHFTPAGEPDGFFSMVYDITAHRRAEEALLASERRFRATFEQAAVGVAMVAPDGRWLRANRRLCDFLGYSLEALQRTTFQAITHPDDLGTDLALVEQVLRGEIDTYAMEKRYRRKDGGIAWAMLTTSLVRDDLGRPDHFVSVIEDIGDRKNAEEAVRQSRNQLRTITDNLPALIAQVDKVEDGLRFGFVNRTAEEWYVRPAASLIGKPVDEVVGRDRYAMVRPHIDAVLAGEPQLFRHEATLPDGKRRWLDARYIPAYTEGAVTGFYALILDVTARVEAQSRLVQAQKMEALGQLTGGIAHDINNMLAVIVGNLDLLRAQTLDRPDLQALVGRVIDSAEKGGALVARLLAFARRHPLQPMSIDAAGILYGMEEMLSRTLGPRIAVRIEAPAEACTSLVDPAQLESAILNLAVNARDAMPNGGALTLSVANATEDGSEFVRIVVADTGTGMAPDVLARATEPFFTTKPAGKGTGIGLSTVHGFVEQSGGQLHIDSAPGQGTRVILDLPRATETRRPAAAAVEPEPRPGKGETVLVVEDDPAVRTFVVEALSALGYRVAEAADAGGALETLDSGRRISLLFSDVILADGMNGVELARQVRRRWPEVKLLLTTGFTESVGGDLADIGAHTEILYKPYRTTELRQSVARALAG